MLCVLAIGAALDGRHGPSWASGIFLTTGTTLLLVFFVDVFWQTGPPPVVLERRPERAAQPDVRLGYRPIPESEVLITCWKDDERIYDVSYHFDKYSRRIVPQHERDYAWREGSRESDRSASSRQHAIFMGGSGVFGENLNDEESLPAQFARHTHGYHVYNYAFSGYGPQQMLERLRSPSFTVEVPEQEGVLLYGYIPDHVGRANGSYSPLAWGSNFPRYIFHGGRLRRNQSFATTQRCRISFFNLLRSSSILNRIALLVEAAHNRRPSNWETFLTLVEQSRDEYLRHYRGRFFTFLWPSSKREYRALADSLRARHVESIDLERYGVRAVTVEDLIPYDNHPNGSYNARAAKALGQAVEERAESPQTQHARPGFGSNPQ
jgi:hypothetical protein